MTETKTPKIRWELPNFKGSGLKRIALDTETDGLDIDGKSVPVGLSICTEDRQSYYIPWGHAAGFNYDLPSVVNWAKDNLVDLDVEFCNAKFDLKGLRKIGIDLEELNCRPADIGLRNGLLTSRREKQNLDFLAEKFLDRGKFVLPGKTPIHLRPSEQVFLYACVDAELTLEIADVQEEFISAEQLKKVQQLEFDLIYPVAHMERTGVLIDRPELERWKVDIQAKKSAIFWQIFRESGVRCEPTKPDSVANLVGAINRNLPKDKQIVLQRTNGTTKKPKGSVSVKYDWLKLQEHPWLQLVYAFLKLQDLESRYVDPYLEALDSFNRLRYNLNQLKSDEYGAVTGRFSASGSKRPEEEGYKVNVQQVVDTDPDAKAYHPVMDAFPIRKLYLPDEGEEWVKADASQIQLRVFAEYVKDQRLINAYRTDPLADFHTVVNDVVLGGRLGEGKAGRKKVKEFNFGQLFGMGIDKIAAKLRISVTEAEGIKALYLANFPVKKLTYDVQGRARHPDMGPHPYTGKIGRGYIRTISKRRRRYEPNENLNSALNAVIQGTEADIMKDKIVQTYRNRKELGITKLFFTVHDELDGSCPKDKAEKVSKEWKEMLDSHNSWETRYGVKFQVPIVWEVKHGATWNL